MAMIGFGTLPLFAATAGMNLAIMESVPAANRPFAVALGTLLMHVLGDVPRARRRRAQDDAWAPSRTPSDGGGIPDDATDECAAERDALRRVILACCVWLVWALIGFGGAWFVAARAICARRAVRAVRVRPRRDRAAPVRGARAAQRRAQTALVRAAGLARRGRSAVHGQRGRRPRTRRCSKRYSPPTRSRRRRRRKRNPTSLGIRSRAVGPRRRLGLRWP